MSLVQLNQREISFADGQLSYSIYECDSCESYFANWSSHQQSSCGKKTPGKKATFSLVLNEIERLYRAGQFSSFVQLRDVYHESPEAFVAGFSPAVQQQIDRDHKGFSTKCAVAALFGTSSHSLRTYAVYRCKAGALMSVKVGSTAHSTCCCLLLLFVTYLFFDHFRLVVAQAPQP